MYALSWFWPQYSDNISKQMFHMVYIKWYAVKLTKYTNLNMKDVFFEGTIISHHTFYSSLDICWITFVISLTNVSAFVAQWFCLWSFTRETRVQFPFTTNLFVMCAGYNFPRPNILVWNLWGGSFHLKNWKYFSAK